MDTDEIFDDSFSESPARISYLLSGFIALKLTPAELLELDLWVTKSKENERVFEEATDPKNIERWLDSYRKLGSEAAIERVKKEKRSDQGWRFFSRREFWLWFVTAIVVAAMVMFFLRKFLAQ